MAATMACGLRAVAARFDLTIRVRNNRCVLPRSPPRLHLLCTLLI